MDSGRSTVNGMRMSIFSSPIGVPVQFRTIESVRRGPIQFKTASDHAMFATPLEAADIIMVKP